MVVEQVLVTGSGTVGGGGAGFDYRKWSRCFWNVTVGYV